MITTYNLGDSHSLQALAANLRADGFRAELVEQPGHSLTVTHETDECGGLDERVYAAAPFADITDTVRSTAIRDRTPGSSG